MSSTNISSIRSPLFLFLLLYLSSERRCAIAPSSIFSPIISTELINTTRDWNISATFSHRIATKTPFSAPTRYYFSHTPNFSSFRLSPFSFIFVSFYFRAQRERERLLLFSFSSSQFVSRYWTKPCRKRFAFVLVKSGAREFTVL